MVLLCFTCVPMKLIKTLNTFVNHAWQLIRYQIFSYMGHRVLIGWLRDWRNWRATMKENVLFRRQVVGEIKFPAPTSTYRRLLAASVIVFWNFLFILKQLDKKRSGLLNTASQFLTLFLFVMFKPVCRVWSHIIISMSKEKTVWKAIATNKRPNVHKLGRNRQALNCLGMIN